MTDSINDLPDYVVNCIPYAACYGLAVGIGSAVLYGAVTAAGAGQSALVGFGGCTLGFSSAIFPSVVADSLDASKLHADTYRQPRSAINSRQPRSAGTTPLLERVQDSRAGAVNSLSG